METAIVVLALLVVGAGAAAVWLLVERGRLVASAAGAAAREAAGRAEVERLGAEAARLTALVRTSEAEVGRLTVEVARLSEQLDAAGRAHAAELVKARELYEAEAASVRREKDESARQLQARLQEVNAKFEAAFRSLATQALDEANKRFAELAEVKLRTQQQAGAAEIEQRKQAVEAMLRPIGEALKATDEKLAAMSKDWAENRGSLVTEIRAIGQAGAELRTETGKLVKALSRPEVRGRWGEIQLRRVAELAGMASYCDFAEQESARDDAGRVLRPDMVVNLPNGRVLAVDAKTNTFAYVEAVSATTDADREMHLGRFVRHVGDQVAELGKKKYWSNYDGSPEFVVMFVPGDQFLDAVLSRDPGLLEKAAESGVIIATPSTLIGLLRAVAVGWREKTLETQAKELFELGKQLHERASVAFGHASKLGESIEAVVKRFNDFAGSYQSRLEPVLRRFEGAGIRSGKDLPAMEGVTVVVKSLPGSAAAGGLLGSADAGERR